jgi:nucleotide-binding universal stress UspA family protein
MSTMVLATDGSKQAEAATVWLSGWARPEDTITVVTVSQPVSPVLMAEMVESYVPLSDATLHNMEETATSIATKILDDACKILRSKGLHCEGTILQGRAAEEIVRYTHSQSPDLLVMGSRGFGPLTGWALGSVSLAVLSHASCPVLVVPSHHGK